MTKVDKEDQQECFNLFADTFGKCMIKRELCINPISTYVAHTLRHTNLARLDKDTCNDLRIHNVRKYKHYTAQSNHQPIMHTRVRNYIPSLYNTNNDAYKYPNLQPQIICHKITHNLIS